MYHRLNIILFAFGFRFFFPFLYGNTHTLILNKNSRANKYTQYVMLTMAILTNFDF